jgi:hypothetical protein
MYLEGLEVSKSWRENRDGFSNRKKSKRKRKPRDYELTQRLDQWLNGKMKRESHDRKD